MITYFSIVVVVIDVIIVVVIILHRLIVIVVVVIRSNTFRVGLANLFSNCVGLYFTINAVAIGHSPFVSDV